MSLGWPVRAPLIEDGSQVIDVTVDGGYNPGLIVARAGIPLEIRIRRTDPDACADRVVFSSPRLERRLALDQTTIVELPGQPVGEIRFTCGMGRYRGRIRVVDGAPGLGQALATWIASLRPGSRTRGPHLPQPRSNRGRCITTHTTCSALAAWRTGPRRLHPTPTRARGDGADLQSAWPSWRLAA